MGEPGDGVVLPALLGVAGLALGPSTASLVRVLCRRAAGSPDGASAGPREDTPPGGAVAASSAPEAVVAGTEQPARRLVPGAGAAQGLMYGGVVGGLWAALGVRLAPEHPWALPAYLVLAFAGVALAAVDLRTHRLPNAVLYPALAAVPALLVAAALLEGAPDRAGRALIALAAVGGTAVVLSLAGAMGMGDAKLLALLAPALAWLSWTALATGLAMGLLLAGAGAAVAVWALGRPARSRVPLGPWLVTGATSGLAFS